MTTKKNGQNEWKQIGVVGVDSGQLMVCDPCYIDSEWAKEEFDENPKAKKNFSYNAVGKKTLSTDCAGQLNYNTGRAGVAVVFSSGFGDGIYPVMAKYEDCGEWGTRITEVKIIMGE